MLTTVFDTGNVCSLRADGSEYLEKDQVVESPATTWLRRVARRWWGTKCLDIKPIIGAPGEIRTPDPLVRSQRL